MQFAMQVILCMLVVILICLAWSCIDSFRARPVESAYGRQPANFPTEYGAVGYGHLTPSESGSYLEHFGVCRDCDTTIPDREIPAAGFSTVNPFIYPYSGAECIDEIQSIVSTHVPLTHATAPDHVVLTN